MPRLNYNSMDHRRSTDPGADESPEETEHRYVNLESFELPDNEKNQGANGARQSTPLLNGKTLPNRVFSYFRGFFDSGSGTYENFPSETLKSVYDVRRMLGTFGGVFAPVALGQLATNIFLRVGKCITMINLLAGGGGGGNGG